MTETTDQTKVTFEQHLAYRVQQGEDAKKQIAEAVQTEGLSWTLEWRADRAIKSEVVASLWAEVERVYTDPNYTTYDNPAASVTAVAKRAERKLVANAIRESSTNELANAVSGVKAAAHAEFVEEAQGMLSALESKKEES